MLLFVTELLKLCHMRHTERVPQMRPDNAFPNGDVTDEKILRRAAAWVAWVDTLEKDAFRDSMNSRYVPRSTDSLASRKTYNAAVYLCREWDGSRGDGRHFVSTGFIISRAFMNDTAIYPNCERDLSVPIDIMKKETSPADFGCVAWRGMFDSHPNLFTHYQSLYDMAAKRFKLNNPSHADSVIAGMMLPYMLSVVGQLEAQTKASRFTSLSDAKYNLRTTEFSELFTSNEPLMKDEPTARLHFHIEENTRED